MKKFYDLFLNKCQNLFHYYNNNKHILIVDRGRYLQSIKATLLTSYLNRKYKLDPLLLSDLRDNDLTTRIFYSLGIREKKIGFRYYLIFLRPIICLKSLIVTIKYLMKIKKKDFYWFIKNFKIEKVNFGDLVYDTYIRNDFSFLNPKIELKFINILFKSCCRIFYINQLFQKKKITKVVLGTVCYSFNDGIVARIALNKKIDVLEMHNFNKIETHTIKKIKFGSLNLKRNDLIKKVKQIKLTKKDLYNFLAKRFDRKIKTNFTSSKDLIATNKNKINYSKDQLLKHVGQKNKKFKKIVLIASHAFSDAPHGLGTEFIFSDYFEQLKQTLLFISKNNNKNILWLVRPNPTSNIYGETNIVENLVRNLNIKNIKLTPKNISSINLIRICDNVITGRGTMGLEFACFGKKPIFAGSATYSGLSFAKEINSKKKYFQQIIQLLKVKKLNNSDILLALKSLYFLETNTSILFNRDPENLIKSSIIKSISRTFDEIESKSKKNQLNIFSKKLIKVLKLIYVNNENIFYEISKRI